MARAEIHVQLIVNFSEDPKIRALTRYGRDARGLRDLYVQMVCYCKRNLTDGFVPTEELGLLVYPDPPKAGIRDAGRLVEVGLAQQVDGGYLLPGFLKRNKSRAQVDAESATKAEAGRKGGQRSGQVRRGGAGMKQSASDGEAETKQGASLWLNTESESETETTKTSSSENAARSSDTEDSDEGPLPNREDVERLCTHLADCIEANTGERPRYGKRWRTSARLLIDRDQRTEQQVHDCIEWCQADNFWCTNILSMPKLREKYTQLRMQAQAQARSPGLRAVSGGHQPYKNPDESAYDRKF